MSLKIYKTLACLSVVMIVISSINTIKAQIINVPSDFQTIALAVQNASPGDTIILSPGTYNEKNINITKPLTVTSQWILEGDESFIDQTIVNPAGSILFSVTADNVEISGLKITNGDHTLDINSRVSIKYNHLISNSDGVSMESNAGGYVGYNVIENNYTGDDCIDVDIGKNGSDILIEHNKLYDSNDDGIEIRLFNDPNQNIHYEIRHNTITGSGKAGIQLISYDIFTGKVFDIHHNLIQSCKAGIGCMEGSNSGENLAGASKMDEKVYLYNNTFLKNEMGATGGNSMIAINNIIADNTIGGFKRFGANSVIANNLFYNNKSSDFIEINGSAEQYDNILAMDPLLDETTFIPGTNSPCIDAGLDKLTLDGSPVIEVSMEDYMGSAPDIGARESEGAPAVIKSYFASGDHHIINYPNPFRLTTNIVLMVSESSDVRVDIYDMTGRCIQTLDEGLRSKGMHTLTWTARDENGNKLPGGTYFARMSSGNKVSNKKMVLL